MKRFFDNLTVRIVERPYFIAPWVTFLFAFFIYLPTIEEGPSLWDCPEYITAALRLEIGHPPGNPSWMLFHRVVATFAPHGLEAWVINLCSALFMSLGSALLSSVIMTAIRIIWSRSLRHSFPARVAAVSASFGGALTFACSDSAWFSAVEAEVYAMSLFLTALCVWLMVGWLHIRESGARSRRLILIAYITGLSIGVHQLNLLVIPALALIWTFGHTRGRPATLRAWLALVWGCAGTGVILLGMMPLTCWFSEQVELFAVNTLHLPFNSGAVFSVIVVMLLAFCFPFVTGRLGLRRTSIAGWMGCMLLTGYLVWLIIPIRAAADPVMNQGDPSNPFYFSSYLSREQYGSTPLFYGQTPYSKPLYREDLHISEQGDSVWKYTEYLRDNREVRYLKGDSSYVAVGHKYRLRYTPELDMWFPRITSRNPSDLPFYASWAGMTDEAMERVKISRTVDENGQPAPLRDSAGVRHPSTELRPTYMQHLRYFITYQVGYMYLRYLMWNYSGRQNDLPSTGEIDHGNFITGFPFIDDAMLGPQELLPPEAGSENPGHNVYYMVPFLLGVAGCFFLRFAGRRGRRILAVSVILFLLTGIAIVFYLNQTPGEPRERDYSFLGSFWTFSFWIGIALAGIALAGKQGKLWPIRLCLSLVLSLGTPLWMLIQNIDDHDRSFRHIPESIAHANLDKMPYGSILFVYGDNFTFPLWYAQNVLGMRRDVVIVNQSYLTTDWYARQLLRPREDDRNPLLLTGRASDFGRREHSWVALPDSATPAMRATEALRLMYADTASMPRIPASVLLLGPEGKEHTSVNLFELFGKKPGGKVQMANILMLDIVATNAASSNPRNVYWQASMSPSAMGGWKPYTIPSGITFRLSIGSEYKGNVIQRVMSLPSDTRYMKPEAYMDPYAGYMADVTRRYMIEEAVRLENEGFGLLASTAVMKALIFCPHYMWPLQPYTSDGKTIYPMIDVVRILMRYSSPENKSIAQDLLQDEKKRYEAWERFYRALPPERRHTLSPRARNLAAGAARINAFIKEMEHDTIPPQNIDSLLLLHYILQPPKNIRLR